jgi:hypothetical protein
VLGEDDEVDHDVGDGDGEKGEHEVGKHSNDASWR